MDQRPGSLPTMQDQTPAHIGGLHRQQSSGGFTFGWWFVKRPDTTMKAHGHDAAHFMFACTQAYASAARGEKGPHPGFLVFNPPQTWHADHLERPGSFFSLTFDAALWQSFHGKRIPSEPSFVAGLRPRMAISRVVQELAGWDAMSPGLCESSCHEIAAVFAEQCRERRRPKWLDRACEMLRARYRENLALQKIAPEVGVHPHHLTKVFRQFEGCTPGEYLLSLKLESAARLICQSRQSLTEIAYATGFSDQSHLSRRFRARMGVTPGEYRRKTGASHLHACFGQDAKAATA